MNKTFIFGCLFSVITINTVSSQVIQDKIYVSNKTCFILQVDQLMGQIQYGQIDSLNPLKQARRVFDIGLLRAAEHTIKYTIFEGKIFAASFEERNGIYKSGPSIISIDSATGFQLLSDAKVQRSLKISGYTTFHLGKHSTFLDGKYLRKALYSSNFERLVYDFAANEQGVFLFLHEQGQLSVRKLYSKGQELRHLGEGITSIREEKEKNKSELLLVAELPGTVSRISSFSLNNELYIFIHDQGQVFQVAGTEIKLVATNLESDTSYLAYALVVDRDQDRIYLLPKQKLKEEKGSFNDMIRKIGIEIELDK